MQERKSFPGRLLSELERRHVLHVAAVYLVAAWLVVQVVSVVEGPLRLPGIVLQLVILLAMLGLPVAVAIAWAFELTPEGVKRSEEAEADGGDPAFTRASRLAVVGLTAIVMTGMGWGAWVMWLSGAPPVASNATDTSARLDPDHVAVLYLRDISPDHNLAYLADGLTETLIHRLGRVTGLTVVPTNGVKPFRDASLPFDSIGRLLHAGTVVDGSVQGAGDRVRIAVNLVDATTGNQIDTKQLDEPLGDPLALQDTVSSEVARFLRKRLGTVVELQRAKESAHDPRAWKLYQVALGLRDDGDSLRVVHDTSGATGLYERADSLFRAAAKLDPSWTQPTLQSGWTHLSMARVRAITTSQADTGFLRQGLEDAARILSEDPDNARALSLRGNLEWWLSQSASVRSVDKSKAFDAAERDLRAATTRDPGLAKAWLMLAYILRGRGEFEEARVAARRMAEADPYLSYDVYDAYLRAQLAIEFHQLGRADSLLAQAEKLFPREATFPYYRLLLVASEPADSTSVKRAWALLDRVESRLPSGGPDQESRMWVAITLARAGLVDSARAVASRAEAIQPGNPARVERNEAYLSLVLGRRDEALRHLKRYLELAPDQRAYNAHDWWWTPLHGDPRFEELVDTTRSAVR